MTKTEAMVSDAIATVGGRHITVRYITLLRRLQALDAELRAPCREPWEVNADYWDGRACGRSEAAHKLAALLTEHGG